MLILNIRNRQGKLWVLKNATNKRPYNLLKLLAINVFCEVINTFIQPKVLQNRKLLESVSPPDHNNRPIT